MQTNFRLPCLMLLLAAGPVQAADISAAETQAVDFAVNFCGGLVGDNPAKLTTAAKRLTGITIHEARPLPDTPAGSRETLTNMLNVEQLEPIHRVTFKARAPGQIVAAYVTPDLMGCQTIITGKSNAFELVSARLRRPDSGWNEINGPSAEQRAWQRTSTNEFVVTFTAGTDDRTTSMGASTHIDMLMPTLSDFDSFANAVVAPCVHLAQSNGRADPQAFASHFTAEPKAADGTIKLMSKVNIPGGQLLLIPARAGSHCVLGVYDTGFPHDYYLRALGDAFNRLPAASKKAARMSSRVEETEGMLLVTIEREK